MKKLAGKHGFTLSELLVTVVILSFLGTAVAYGIATAGRAYRDVTMSSEAAVLSGTLAVKLADELRFAEDISGSTFTSRRFGPGVSVESAAGRVTIGGSPVLSESVYTGLNAQASAVYSGGSFAVNIVISTPGSGGTQILTSNFSVTPISG